MRNLASLGAQPAAFGAIGDDASGHELHALLSDTSVDVGGVVRDKSRRTTEKTRIIAGSQQVVRVDTEDTAPLSRTVTEDILARIARDTEDGCLAAIIVEDYGKGGVTAELLQEVVELARSSELPVALDPHPGNPLNSKGLTVMTPNRSEAFALAGAYFVEGVMPIETDTPLLKAANTLESLWSPEYLLVTLGPDGMALFREGEPTLHVPTHAKEVFDVSGAGDTVIASFVLALAADASPEAACIISNHAAGIVVGKVGTAPVYPEELLQTFQTDID